MMHLVNRTRFEALALPAVCHEDNHHIVIIVKGTFNVRGPEKGATVADQQTEINLEDVYWGEPGKFSLKYEADTAISKPGTDVALIGKARSRGGPVTQLDVGLRVGTMSKVVRVFGNRYWQKSATGWSMTAPEAFEAMPLVYEFAYGGTDPWQEPDGPPDVDQRNPVGRGYAGSKSHKATDRIPLPNLELPDQLITDIRQRPQPAGFGFIARNWQPRSLLMGTYDEAWEKQRNPLLPKDFDPACYAAASAGLCSDNYLSGGEEVTITNVTANGQMNFNLPMDKVKVVSYINQQRVEHDTVLDTVIIEPHRNTVVLTWRVAIRCHWNLSMVEWLKVLEV
jgi:hypothetical protein